MAAYCCFNKLCQRNKSIKYSIESESYFSPYIVKLMKVCYFAKFFRISLFTCLFEYSNMHPHVAFVFVQTEGFIHFKSTRNVITDKNTGKMWILVIGCKIFKCNNLLVRRCLHCWLISNGKTAISHKCIDRIMLIFLITWHCLFSTNITCLTRVYLHAVLFNP